LAFVKRTTPSSPGRRIRRQFLEGRVDVRQRKASEAANPVRPPLNEGPQTHRNAAHVLMSIDDQPVSSTGSRARTVTGRLIVGPPGSGNHSPRWRLFGSTIGRYARTPSGLATPIPEALSAYRSPNSALVEDVSSVAHWGRRRRPPMQPKGQYAIGNGFICPGRRMPSLGKRSLFHSTSCPPSETTTAGESSCGAERTARARA
jgi:hypothetical protein